MFHLFVVLKVSSLIKKGLSSTCHVILVCKLAWPRGSLSANTDDSCWNFSMNTYAAPSCAKATMTIIHGRQANAIQMISSNIKGYRATIQIQVDNEDKQIKQNAM